MSKPLVYLGWVKYRRCYPSCKVLYLCPIERTEWIKNITAKLACSSKSYRISRLGSCCDLNRRPGLGAIKLRRAQFWFQSHFSTICTFCKSEAEIKSELVKLYGPQVWSLNSLFQRKKLISGTIAHKNYTWVNKIFTLYTSKHL